MITANHFYNPLVDGLRTMTTSILTEQIGLRQLAKDTFSARWHKDWTVGPTLLGSCVAATIQLAAQTYLQTDPTLLKVNQPDVLNLHIEFLRACTHHDSIIKVVPLKIGGIASTLQLQLLQKDKVKAIALATSTNFEKSLGPSVPPSASWKLSPPPRPKPDLTAALADRPVPDWVPASYDGEILPLTRRLLVLNPRGGFPDDGVCDAWNGFRGGERIDATYLALMADIMPSMSDTLLRNGGPYDGHEFQRRAEQWAEEKPGVPLFIKTNSVAEMKGMATINTTLTLDIEYKRRLPKEGLRFTFTRATSQTLLDGRMDLELTICNEDMEVVCLVRQLILALEAQRKFSHEEKKEPGSKL